MKQVVALAVAAGLVSSPAEATIVCHTPDEYFGEPSLLESEPSEQDVARFREECRQLRRNRRANMRAVERGELDLNAVLSLAYAYEDTEYGCPGDSAFAFDLIEAAFPDPITLAAVNGFSSRLSLARLEAGLEAHGRRLAPERIRNIRNMNWLNGGASASAIAFVPSDADIDAMLADPQLRAFAIEHRYANNDLLEAFSTPARPAFDRLIYADLVLRTYAASPHDAGLAALVNAARLLLDPTHGEPDVVGAQRVLSAGQFSPYFHRESGAADADAIGLWRQVGQHLSASADPVERSFGVELAVSGDPMIGLRSQTDLPENARILAQWPAQLGMPSWQADPVAWQRALDRIGTNYPSRALRMEQTGPVETALHYAADGSLVGFVVVRSSGSQALDAMVVQNWTRYFRPRPLATLPAELIDGRDLFIRMPTVEYHIDLSTDRDALSGRSGVQLEDGRIIVTGAAHDPSDQICA